MSRPPLRVHDRVAVDTAEGQRVCVFEIADYGRNGAFGYAVFKSATQHCYLKYTLATRTWWARVCSEVLDNVSVCMTDEPCTAPEPRYAIGDVFVLRDERNVRFRVGKVSYNDGKVVYHRDEDNEEVLIPAQKPGHWNWEHRPYPCTIPPESITLPQDPEPEPEEEGDCSYGPDCQCINCRYYFGNEYRGDPSCCCGFPRRLTLMEQAIAREGRGW